MFCFPLWGKDAIPMLRIEVVFTQLIQCLIYRDSAKGPGIDAIAA